MKEGIIVQTPRTLSGAPRIDGRRLSTDLLYGMVVRSGQSVSLTADDFEISEEEVIAAIRYESARRAVEAERRAASMLDGVE